MAEPGGGMVTNQCLIPPEAQSEMDESSRRRWHTQASDWKRTVSLLPHPHMVGVLDFGKPSSRRVCRGGMSLRFMFTLVVPGGFSLAYVSRTVDPRPRYTAKIEGGETNAKKNLPTPSLLRAHVWWGTWCYDVLES